MTADDIIKKLNLIPHPREGGYFFENYRSEETLPADNLPERYKSEKSISTAIYYLLTDTSHSALHKLKTDEVFHFYLGDPVEMLHLYPDGSGRIITLGHDITQDQHVQLVVPRDTWQGSHLKPGGKFALLGTTMAPGFDYDDYTAADHDQLVEKYADYKDLIDKLA